MVHQLDAGLTTDSKLFPSDPGMYLPLENMIHLLLISIFVLASRSSSLWALC